ncbi:MAG: DUF58 domain-containing protein [bacterium]
MISKEILKKIKRIEITTRHLVDTVLQGEYLSSFKGRGIEFTEVREYQEGDDIRAIDWNVTARMNTPYIKIFIEERELQVIFAADLSGSLEFGSKENLKSELMFEFVAALGFTANLNNDRVGFLGFSSGLEKYVPPKKGKKHVLRILRELAYHEQKNKETNLSESLLYLSHILKRRSTVFVISDFYDEKDYYSSLKVLKYHHDVIAVVLRDRRDYEMADIGYAPFVDPETNNIAWLDTADKNTLDKLKKNSDAADKKLFKTFKSLGIDYLVLNCGEAYIKTLILFFKKREGRRGK